MRGFYERVSQDSQYESATDDEEIKASFIHTHRSSLPAHWRFAFVLLSAVLFFSLVANALFLYLRFYINASSCHEQPSQYAHLTPNIQKDITAPEVFSDANRTVQDDAWADPRLNSWDLYVALDDQYVEAQGLPRSQRWPWDSNKGVYTIQAGHELHCVRVIRSVLLQSYEGVPESEWAWAQEHAVHCLNVLRETVMCNADDYPLYVGKLHKNAEPGVAHQPGNGMQRQCRDWDALMDFAHKHSACYSSVHREDPEFDELERYKFCPDGSRPWENMDAL